MIVDELLNPAKCKVPGASPVYDDLLEFVQNRYHDKPRETRAIIFALAYTRYSKTKKVGINETYNLKAATEAEKRDNAVSISTLIRSLRNDNSFDDDCKNALATFEYYRAESFKQATDTVVATVQRIMSPQRSFLHSLRHFLLESLKYAAKIMVATIIIIVAANIMKIVAPVAVDAFIINVEKIVTPLRSSAH